MAASYESFALGVLRDFAPGHEIVAVTPKRRFNGGVIPKGHRHAVLSSDGETLATSHDLEQVIEEAAREALRRYARRAERDAYCLARMRAALKTIETGGAE